MRLLGTNGAFMSVALAHGVASLIEKLSPIPVTRGVVYQSINLSVCCHLAK